MPTNDNLDRQLIVAAAMDDVERVRYLIDHYRVPVDTTFEDKPNALCYAAMKGNRPLLEYLLEQGADSNYQDGLGQTPLIYAVLGGHADIVTRLLLSGADAGQRNSAGDTALCLAQRRGTRCCIDALSYLHLRSHRLH